MKNKIDINSYEYKIGQNISRIRSQNGFRQSDMESYGISRAYYGRIELGIHSLSLKKMLIISRALGVRPSDLFKDATGKEIL